GEGGIEPRDLRFGMRPIEKGQPLRPSWTVVIFSVETLLISMLKDFDHFASAFGRPAVFHPCGCETGGTIESLDLRANIREDRPAQIVQTSGLNDGAAGRGVAGFPRRPGTCLRSGRRSRFTLRPNSGWSSENQRKHGGDAHTVPAQASRLEMDQSLNPENGVMGSLP